MPLLGFLSMREEIRERGGENTTGEGWKENRCRGEEEEESGGTSA